MPCLIITGHPSAGKTTVAKLLRERALLHKAIDEVVLLNEESECGCGGDDVDGGGGDGGGGSKSNIIRGDGSDIPSSEQDGFPSVKTTQPAATKSQIPASSPSAARVTKQQCYETAASEKQTRSTLKSAFDRAVGGSRSGNNGDDNNSSRRRCRLVILDSLNYIKGFRYELHCISKAAGEQHGVLWVVNKISVVQDWNTARGEGAVGGDGYSPELLRELISRYEPPDERNRWDKPLFTVDVAPTLPIDSSRTTQANYQDTSISKSDFAINRTEVLEKSVYNMHSLGDTMGISEEKGSTNATISSSTFSRAPPAVKPKKSAFQRKCNPSLTNNLTGYRPSTASTLTIANLASRNDTCTSDGTHLIPTGQQQCSAGANATPRQTSAGAPVETTAAAPSRTTPLFVSVTDTAVPKKPLEEQLDEILDIFLTQTKALKEGISTRQNMAGQANVLQNLDSLSAKLIAAMASAQNSHTGGHNLQVPLPAAMNNEDNNVDIGTDHVPTLKYLSMKCPRPVGLAELRRLRKMYLQWAAIHPPEDTSEIGIATSFVRYIEDKL